MPLNREKGEVLGALGSDFRVADAQKWADLTQIQGQFELPVPHDAIKFQESPDVVQMPVFMHAMWIAKEAFRKAGAMLPVTIESDDIIVQEYPSRNEVVFIFQRDIVGQTFYSVCGPYGLNEEIIRSLTLAGKWSRPKAELN